MYIDKLNMMFGKLQEKSTFLQFWQKKNRVNISIYQSLSQINIELWNEILSTQNIYLLDKEYSDKKRYSKEETKLISETFSSLYDDYFVKLDNSFAKANLKETQEKVQLSAKIIILTDCVNSLQSIKRNYKILKEPLKKEQQIYDCVKIISKYVKFDKFATIDENIEVIIKIIQSNELSYKRKFSDEKSDSIAVNYTFEKQVVDVEQVLGRSIDISNTNVLKWIGYINLAKEISKKRQENGSKK